MKQLRLQEIFNKLSILNSQPEIELDYSTNFNFLCAVIMSAQATDKQVNKVTADLFKFLKEPSDVIEMGLERLTQSINRINYFNNKAKNIYKMSQMLIEKFNGKVPDNIQDLVSLPGVGRKTANVYLNEIYNMPTIAVDTHVSRVSQRLKFTKNTIPEKIEDDLNKLFKKFEDDFVRDVPRLLVLHGRYICKSQRPVCNKCPVYDLCDYDKKS